MNTKPGRLVARDRLASSRNGNPRFRLTVDILGTRHKFNTKTDGSVGYDAENHRLGSIVVLTIDGRGDVVDIEAAK